MDRNNEHLDKKLDRLLSDDMKEKQQAPVDFMSKVMANVEQYEASKLSIQYKPLISKKQWILIFSGILGLIVFAFITGGFNLNPEIFAYVNLNLNPDTWLTKFSLPMDNWITDIHFSPVFSTALVMICSFLIVSLIIIRKYVIR